MRFHSNQNLIHKNKHRHGQGNHRQRSKSDPLQKFNDWVCVQWRGAHQRLSGHRADALPMIAERDPAVATEVVDQLPLQEPLHGCLQELHDASGTCRDSSGDQVGSNCVTARDHQGSAWDPGEWPHGWQCSVSSTLDSFPEVVHVCWPKCCSSGPSQVSFWTSFRCALSHAPTTPEFTIQHLFQVLLRERLRLPLFLTESTCSGCHEPLDPLAPSRFVFPSRRIQRRAIPIKRVMARRSRFQVKFNALLRDVNVRVASSARRIEVFAQGLPCFGGSQLAVQSCCKHGSTSTPNSSMCDAVSWW